MGAQYIYGISRLRVKAVISCLVLLRYKVSYDNGTEIWK